MTTPLFFGSAIICSFIFSVTIPLGFVGNVAVFLVFRRSWRLRTWENAFHLNIATINLFMCTLQAPTILFLMWNDNVASPAYHGLCTFSQAGLLGFVGILVSHAQISVLRCMKVYNPCHVPNKCIIVSTLIIPWIAGFLVTVQTFVTDSGILFAEKCRYKHFVKETCVFYTMIIVLLMSCIVLVTSYSLIFAKLRTQRKVITSRDVFTITQNCNRSTRVIYPTFPNHVNNACPMQTTMFGNTAIRHMVGSSVALLIMFLVTAMPPLIALIVFQRMFLSHSVTSVIYSFTYFAYILSPLVYTFRNREFKQTLRSLVKRSNKVNFSLA